MNLQMGKYLTPTPIIDCDSPAIQEKTKDLTKGQENVIEKAKSLFYFVRDEIKYNMYSPFHLFVQRSKAPELRKTSLSYPLCVIGGDSRIIDRRIMGLRFSMLTTVHSVPHQSIYLLRIW